MSFDVHVGYSLSLCSCQKVALWNCSIVTGQGFFVCDCLILVNWLNVRVFIIKRYEGTQRMLKILDLFSTKILKEIEFKSHAKWVITKVEYLKITCTNHWHSYQVWNNVGTLSFSHFFSESFTTTEVEELDFLNIFCTFFHPSVNPLPLHGPSAGA